MSDIHATLSSNALDSKELFDILSGELASVDAYHFELKERSDLFRSPGLDQTTLIAVVAGTSAAITALINGIFRLIETRYNRTAKVVIRGSDGTTVEVPMGTPPQELRELVDVAKTLNRPEIRIIVAGDSPSRDRENTLLTR